MKIYENIIQQTPEWYAIKRGKMSASHATAIGNAGKGLNTYILEIVESMICGNDGFSNKDMERGNELEPIARKTYEFETGNIVKQIGFIEYNDYVGCSPDGLVNDDGGLELKARNNKIHLSLLLTDKVDSSTIWQMQMNMLISGRNWWDFGSYNPNFKQSLYLKRFYPDEDYFSRLKKGFEIGEKKLKELLANKRIQFELS